MQSGTLEITKRSYEFFFLFKTRQNDYVSQWIQFVSPIYHVGNLNNKSKKKKIDTASTIGKRSKYKAWAEILSLSSV